MICRVRGAELQRPYLGYRGARAMYKPLRKKQSAESAIHKPSRRLSARFIPFSDMMGLILSDSEERGFLSWAGLDCVFGSVPIFGQDGADSVRFWGSMGGCVSAPGVSFPFSDRMGLILSDYEEVGAARMCRIPLGTL